MSEKEDSPNKLFEEGIKFYERQQEEILKAKKKQDLISSSIAGFTAILVIITLTLTEKPFALKKDKVDMEISSNEIKELKQSIRNLENYIDRSSPADKASLSIAKKYDEINKRIKKIEIDNPNIRISNKMEAINNRVVEIEKLLKKDSSSLIQYHLLAKDVDYLIKDNSTLILKVEELSKTIFDFYKWIIGLASALIIPFLIKVISNIYERSIEKDNKNITK